MAGECCNCHDKIFLILKCATKFIEKYNALEYEQKEEKEKYFKGAYLENKSGTKVSVALTFLSAIGRNIHVGNNVSVNMNCTL